MPGWCEKGPGAIRASIPIAVVIGLYHVPPSFFEEADVSQGFHILVFVDL